MFGMAMIGVLTAVGAVSCSKENPEGSEDFSNEKKLVKMVAKDENGKDLEVFTFKYDGKGRLIESTGSFDYGEQSWTKEYVWGDNAIACNGSELPLKDGLIQHPKCTYHSSNRVIKYDDATIIWDGDKIVSMSSYIGTDLKFIYGEPCKKGYNPLLLYVMTEYQETFYAHPELIGARTRQLPIWIGEMSLKYEFDNEGYITKIYINQSKHPMVLTWE